VSAFAFVLILGLVLLPQFTIGGRHWHFWLLP
jgi:hypothetical protein